MFNHSSRKTPPTPPTAPARSTRTTWTVALFAGALVVAAGCVAKGSRVFAPEILPLPAAADEYDPIASYDYMEIPADNPISAEKAALGRQLYYDYRLSGDGSRSCYHCHQVDLGLTDGLPLAIGAFEKQLTRSSPTMWNIGYHQFWYWDGRADTLEKQAAAAWKGGNMGAKDTAPVLAEINAIKEYHAQFQEVFGSDATEENVSQALATYMRTIISNDTAYDRYVAGEESALSEGAKRGWETFQRIGCTECHAGVLFTDLQFHNVGIAMDVEDYDVGRFKVTQRPQDRGAFKTPTLRDVTKSAPYFHDGSVATIEEAVRYMAGGGTANEWLSDKLKPHELSDAEVDDLVEFLRHLEQPATDAVRPPPIPGTDD